MAPETDKGQQSEQRPNGSSAPAILLEHFGVAFSQKTVLKDISLTVKANHSVIIVGPASAGKSTLLRTLARCNDVQPDLRTWGTAQLSGRNWREAPAPAIVMQRAQLFIATVYENLNYGLAGRTDLSAVEKKDTIEALLLRYGLDDIAKNMRQRVSQIPRATQRRLNLARTLLCKPELLMVDELTLDLDEPDRISVIQFLKQAIENQSAMLITHNRQDALDLEQDVALIAAGRVHEQAPASIFFRNPTSVAGKLFVETGTCHLVESQTFDQPLSESDESPPEQQESILPTQNDSAIEGAPFASATTEIRPRIAYPTGFRWVIDKQLGAMPRPGLLSELEDDIDALKNIGVQIVLCLEESQPIPATEFSKRQIELWHLPIVDMKAPLVAETVLITQRIHSSIINNSPIVVHCKAGLGRTGTILAAYLIAHGSGVVDAVERIRKINPRFVQSEEQLQFLELFAKNFT